MSDCRCEPHASGSNRCASCRLEDAADGRLGSAVALIKAVASGYESARCAVYAGHSNPKDACNGWLERNGYECDATRKRAREVRAAQLDAEIERLRAERERL